jgi:hypothetical protein
VRLPHLSKHDVAEIDAMVRAALVGSRRGKMKRLQVGLFILSLTTHAYAVH